MEAITFFMPAMVAALSFNVLATDTYSQSQDSVTDEVIAQQRHILSANSDDKGFGPQAPRDINSTKGNNRISFSTAPPHEQMNLCNIHFHKNAEHKGGEFTRYAGNGDGQGNISGYQYSGHLTREELAPVDHAVCSREHDSLVPGDTIEVHYVYSTAQINPGPTLASCLSDSIQNPQLRVEAQVYVLVNDKDAGDFAKLTKHAKKGGLYQALNIPRDTGKPIQYAGSTTGPGYNETGSPFQVSWSVRPKVAKVNITSVGGWCSDNVFDEDHAHGVRNLVTNLDLLSQIQ